MNGGRNNIKNNVIRIETEWGRGVGSGVAGVSFFCAAGIGRFHVENKVAASIFVPAIVGNNSGVGLRGIMGRIRTGGGSHETTTDRPAADSIG